MDNKIKYYKNISSCPTDGSDLPTMYYMTSIMTICPTEDCKDCTGSISNDLIRHRFVCKCPCHLSVEKRHVRAYDNDINNDSDIMQHLSYKGLK